MTAISLLTYLFRLCFNQCNASLHFGSSKHSASFQKLETLFPLQPWFVASTLGSLNNSLVLALIFCLASLVGSQPCFPRGGVGCFFYVFPNKILFINPVCIPQTVFRICACFSSFLGRWPDGSGLILAHPHVWGQ